MPLVARTTHGLSDLPIHTLTYVAVTRHKYTHQAVVKALALYGLEGGIEKDQNSTYLDYSVVASLLYGDLNALTGSCLNLNNFAGTYHASNSVHQLSRYLVSVCACLYQDQSQSHSYGVQSWGSPPVDSSRRPKGPVLGKTLSPGACSLLSFPTQDRV